MAEHKKIDIRIDDVLLLNNLTGSMKNSLRYNSFFGHFLTMDAFLQKHNLHATLTLLAEGIEAYPEWVHYINLHKHRYTIQLHGYSHHYYKGMTMSEAYESLSKARDMIEKAFQVKVTRWYVPFGRHFFPEWSLEVCKMLGLEFHTRGGTTRHYYFHYWNSRDRSRLDRIYKQYGKQFETTNRELVIDLGNKRKGD